MEGLIGKCKTLNIQNATEGQIAMNFRSVEEASWSAPLIQMAGLEGTPFKIKEKYYMFKNGKVVKTKKPILQNKHQKYLLGSFGRLNCEKFVYGDPQKSEKIRIMLKYSTGLTVIIYKSSITIPGNGHIINNKIDVNARKFDCNSYRLSDDELINYLKSLKYVNIIGGYLINNFVETQIQHTTPIKIFVAEECVICLSDTPATMITPCNHKCLCADCTKNFGSELRKCPMCRGVVSSLI